MPTTSRLALPYPALSDTADVPRDIQALATPLDAAAVYAQGTLVGRPAAGVTGRIYRATDTGQAFLDTGTAWLTLGQYAEGTATGRPAAGTAGRVYRATDTGAVSLDTGAAWIGFTPAAHAATHATAGADPITPAAIGAQAAVALVTSLPGSPADGDECFYLADSTNGIVWHLRYRAASSSTYKWEYVGGPPLAARVDTVESGQLPLGSYNDLPTVGPQVTVPLAGDYVISGASHARFGATGAVTSQVAPKFGAAAVSASDNVMYFVMPGQASSLAQGSMGGREFVKTALAASTLIKLMYNFSAGTTGTAVFGYRSISARPVRVG